MKMMILSTTKTILALVLLSRDSYGWAINDDKKLPSLADPTSLRRSSIKNDDLIRFESVLALPYRENDENVSSPTVRSLQDSSNSGEGVEGGSSLLTTRTFPECIEQNLSPIECKEYIETLIMEAGGHEVGDDVQVKIRTPRTPEEFADSYWMVEVPVNIGGDVACDRNEGLTHYPYKWKDGATGKEFNVGAQDCYGLTGAECCTKIRNYGKTLTETGYDHNGQCLSCFIHQEPLEPVIDKFGNVVFLDYRIINTNNDEDEGSSSCVQGQFTSVSVDVSDDKKETLISGALSDLKLYHEEVSDCGDFHSLLRRLYDVASVIPPLSQKIGQLACKVCYNPEYDVGLRSDVVFQLLDEMISLLEKYEFPYNKEINSKEKCIIIHTNANGDEIVQDPTFGSGRTDLSATVLGTASPTHSPTGAPTEFSCNIDPSICQRGFYCAFQTTRCTGEGCSNYNVGGTVDEFDWYECLPIDCDNEDDPSACPNGQYCHRVFNGTDPFEATFYDYFYECLPNTCGQDPSICPDNQFCEYIISDEFGNEDYVCTPNTCVQDPTLCSETEWCHQYEDDVDTSEYEDYGGECIENICVGTNPPDDCHEDHLQCAPMFDESLGNYYKCEEKPCNEYPNICAENEYCRAIINDKDDEEEITYTCTVYEDVQDICGFRWIEDDFGYDTEYYSIYECDPSVSFCYDSTNCEERFNPRKYNAEQSAGRCVAYGASCSDENGDFTQKNCQSDEHCEGNNPNSRCKPNLTRNKCCDPKSNDCGNEDDEEGTLWCAPSILSIPFDSALHKFYTCQPRCNTDDDCRIGEWCAPVKESNSSSSQNNGNEKKFCKSYVGNREWCHVTTPELREASGDVTFLSILHTEERCDPSNMYCENYLFCYVEEPVTFLTVPQCIKYNERDECTNSDDCYAFAYCDVTVGICKGSLSEGDCCTTSGDNSVTSDCGSPLTCQLVTEEVIDSLNARNLTLSLSDFLPGATVCA